jgi:hypothetical protein
MPQNYRKPTDKELGKMETARNLTQRGIEGQKDFLSKISTTMAKSARDDEKRGRHMFESVPAAAREYEAYNQAGYAKGGSVSSASKRADGCAQRGKTKGRMV